MAIQKMPCAVGSGGGSADLTLLDSYMDGSNNPISRTYQTQKAGYLYVYVVATGYGGDYGGDCTITVNGTTVTSADYLVAVAQNNITGVYIAKLNCQNGDVISVTATGRGNGYHGDAIMFVG